jgi:hypothetical protein
MIDDLAAWVVADLMKFVPNFVWGLLFGTVGVALTAIGVALVGESPQVGGAFLAIGVVMLASVGYAWYR